MLSGISRGFYYFPPFFHQSRRSVSIAATRDIDSSKIQQQFFGQATHKHKSCNMEALFPLSH